MAKDGEGCANDNDDDVLTLARFPEILPGVVYLSPRACDSYPGQPAASCMILAGGVSARGSILLYVLVMLRITCCSRLEYLVG